MCPGVPCNRSICFWICLNDIVGRVFFRVRLISLLAFSIWLIYLIDLVGTVLYFFCYYVLVVIIKSRYIVDCCTGSEVYTYSCLLKTRIKRYAWPNMPLSSELLLTCIHYSVLGTCRDNACHYHVTPHTLGSGNV